MRRGISRASRDKGIVQDSIEESLSLLDDAYDAMERAYQERRGAGLFDDSQTMLRSYKDVLNREIIHKLTNMEREIEDLDF